MYRVSGEEAAVCRVPVSKDVNQIGLLKCWVTISNRLPAKLTKILSDNKHSRFKNNTRCQISNSVTFRAGKYATCDKFWKTLANNVWKNQENKENKKADNNRIVENITVVEREKKNGEMNVTVVYLI